MAMIAFQLIGQGAFIISSLALGTKLLLLWRRTKEMPELSLGLAFVFGGGLATIAWFLLAALRLTGANAETLHTVKFLGLATCCVGNLANGVGVFRIYRSESKWPVPFIACLAAIMLACLAFQWFGSPTASGLGFWTGLSAGLPLYVWGSVEALVLALSLHKRAQLGLADPIVVNRLFQWSIAGAMTIGMIGVSVASRLVHGPLLPAWIGTMTSAFGLIAAIAIWLGFFPPRSLRARITRAYGS